MKKWQQKVPSEPRFSDKVSGAKRGPWDLELLKRNTAAFENLLSSMAKENEAPASSNQEASPPATLETVPEDRKRNWNEDTTMSLVRAWHEVAKGGYQLGEKTTMYNERIFAGFKKLVPSSTRSKKAVEDKMQALREMYRFISDVNANRIQGSTEKAEWFELSRKEKKELRYGVVQPIVYSGNEIMLFDIMCVMRAEFFHKARHHAEIQTK
ncbi:unnamed protein product [Phytophthora fragariaefolia]|uniref:Unnamed protein product n=1 Tax=Phytophthora fragariaefolia TaxID=1490495 RepID=A0A9W6Y2A3_9STRA|nr:unnamed protein product [Phytophthora fragariaefolia]